MPLMRFDAMAVAWSPRPDARHVAHRFVLAGRGSAASTRRRAARRSHSSSACRLGVRYAPIGVAGFFETIAWALDFALRERVYVRRKPAASASRLAPRRRVEIAGHRHLRAFSTNAWKTKAATITGFITVVEQAERDREPKNPRGGLGRKAGTRCPVRERHARLNCVGDAHGGNGPLSQKRVPGACGRRVSSSPSSCRQRISVVEDAPQREAPTHAARLNGEKGGTPDAGKRMPTQAPASAARMRHTSQLDVAHCSVGLRRAPERKVPKMLPTPMAARPHPDNRPGPRRGTCTRRPTGGTVRDPLSTTSEKWSVFGVGNESADPPSVSGDGSASLR